jgi:hypothetical protein
VTIENFEKKIHGRVKILGWYKNQHGTFSGSKLLADFKNVHVLYVWWSNFSTTRTDQEHTIGGKKLAMLKSEII